MGNDKKLRPSRFERLGEDYEVDREKELKSQAAGGDLEASAKLEYATNPENVRTLARDILLHHLDDANQVLQEFYGKGLPRPDLEQPAAYARQLGIRIRELDALDPDYLIGRVATTVRFCRAIIDQLENEPEGFNAGVVLGYSLAQHHFRALREWKDGPDLARERENSASRAAGGRARAQSKRGDSRRVEAREAYEVACAKNSSLSKTGWAKKNAAFYNVSWSQLSRWISLTPKN